MKQMIGLLLIILVAMMLPSAAFADAHLTQVAHIDPFEMMGQQRPARDDTISVWISEDKASTHTTSGESILVRGDKGVIYLINHMSKTYSEIPINLESDGDDSKSEQMKGMMGAMGGKMEVTVTPTEETKKIQDWTATKYMVESSMPMGSRTSETWASEDIKIDRQLLNMANNALMAVMPGFKDIIKEMNKIDGVVIYSIDEMNMMGTKVTSSLKVVEFAEKDPPANVYEIPEGYTKKEMSMMGGH